MVPTAPLQCVVQGDFKLGAGTRMISSLDGLYSSTEYYGVYPFVGIGSLYTSS
jgi:hypothetical protein